MELYRQVHTIETVEHWARYGWVDLNRFDGLPKCHRLTPADKPLFDRAKTERFLTGRYSNDCRDLWWYYCSARRWPFMVVRYARKYADIWVDVLSTVGGKLPERSPCIVDLLYGLLERREKGLPRRAGACGGQVGVSIYDIPIQLSSEIAVEVREIIFPLVEALRADRLPAIRKPRAATEAEVSVERIDKIA